MTIILGNIVDFSFLFRGKLLSKAVKLRISADISAPQYFMLIRLCKLGCGFFASTLAKDAPFCGGQPKLGSFTIFGGTFVTIAPLK